MLSLFKMTDSQYKALNILNSCNNGIHAKAFYEKMWMEGQEVQCYKITKGMWLSAGSYLNKLKKQRLVDSKIINDRVLWFISKEGVNLLR